MTDLDTRLAEMPLRLRLDYWMRRCPKMTLKTCVLIVGPLLWLLYLFSTNYIYANQRPITPIHTSVHPLPLDGQILRRPTVPIFEGVEEPIQIQSNAPNSNDTDETGNESRKSEFRTFRRGDFTVLSDAIKRNKEYEGDQSVTLTTHATYDLLDNLVTLSRHWAGPISVAVYAPNVDFRVAFDYSLWLRHCYPDVADYATFQFVYPYEDHPKIKQNQTQQLASVETSANNTTGINYLQVAGDLILKYLTNLSISCKPESFILPPSYRHHHNIPYPINVCRNVARLSATTHFVLASDIELYPSANVIPLFLSFSRKHGLFNRTHVQQKAVNTQVNNKLNTGIGTITVTNIFGGGGSVVSMPSTVVTNRPKKVFVLPIFEVDKKAMRVPTNKTDLVQLYRERKVVYFHKHVCSFCNIIPRLNKWLTSRVQNGVLDVFMTVKRHRPFNRWEPIYIGTNEEPLYDERFTWEGQQDKMTQMYELCLLNYDLAILDSAFLVHRTGIKTKNATEYKLKSSFIAHNNKVYKKSIRDLEKKHGMNPWCK